MALGIRTFFDTTADIVVTNSAALITTGLTSPIAANQRQKLRWWIPVTVGATGGVRAQIIVPAAGVVFIETFCLYNNTTSTVIVDTLLASAVIGNALAAANEHWLEIQATIVNGVNAGNVDLQMAQNTADALSLTIRRGASLDVLTQ